MARVFITGLGAVSSLGLNVNQSWNRLLLGHSGISYEKNFDSSTWPSLASACVEDAFFSSLTKDVRDLPRFIPFALEATKECLEDSGLLREESRSHLSSLNMFVGSGIGALNPLDVYALQKGLQDRDFLQSELFQKVIQKKRIVNHPNTLGAILSGLYGMHGDCVTIQTACASSAQALGQAFLLLKHGQIQRALVIGADSLSAPLHRSGFDLIGALSRNRKDLEKVSRPFDKKRDGFVPGEGAAALMLESDLDSNFESSKKIYAEVVGYGETLSAFRITDLPPDGRGIFEAMQQALLEAGISPREVQYINAHGTSTEVNDRIELLAIKRLFFSEASTPWVASTKSMTGHLISGAGALEAVICAKSLIEGFIPPSINIEEVESGYEDIPIPRESKKIVNYSYALSNSIGFGGSNASILLKNFRANEIQL